VRRSRFRLIVITDRTLATPRPVQSVVAEALEAGAPAIQLRDKSMGARDLAELGRELRDLTRRHDALLFVNDRVDVALAVEADGVHLGPDDLPVDAVRGVVPDGFLIGYSTDDPGEAVMAVSSGADYIGCGAVWPTGSKSDAGNAIGPEGLRAVAKSVSVPVVGIGGITADRAGLLSDTGAAGVAVIGAVMAADDPGAEVRRLLQSFDESG
jgi:thiamine-phosphate pyrophosphorylase